MSTDRELLELAAKAAGMEIGFHDSGSAWNWDEDYTRHVIWNPLSDDGDALRLAVVLCLDIHCDGDACAALYGSSDGPVCFEQKCHSDHFAGVRLAIVRAAAEIGRNMP